MNENIIYGSHNTMTYLRPQHWYGWFMLPFARCQKGDLEQQWKAGVRCFDLRIRFTKKGIPYFAHGLYECSHHTSPYTVLLVLATKAVNEKETIHVRLILEDTKKKDYNETYFLQFCRWAERTIVAGARFYGGNRKGDWKKVYTFPDDTPDALNNQWVGSMADDANCLEKIMPFLYAWRHNRKNKVKMKEKFNLFDFV